MATDDERREAAQRLRKHKGISKDITFDCILEECVFDAGTLCIEVSENCASCRDRILDRLADLMDPEPDMSDDKATAGGWTVKVYDPEGLLLSSSNLASDLARFICDKEANRDRLRASEV